MPRWKQGEATIERMLEQRELDRAPVDADTVAALINAARRHIDSATSLIEDDPEGAYALVYDAARKSATSLLAHQGLRPTSAGGHIVVVEAMRVQFPEVRSTGNHRVSIPWPADKVVAVDDKEPS